MTQPPYVWTPPVVPGRPRRSRRTVTTVISVLAALVVVLAAVAGYLLWRAQDADASVLEPTNSATADAFMPAHGPDASVATPSGNSGGAVTGSTPGLFGGTSDNSTCDRDQIAEFLQVHPDKAAAWAEAEGVGTGDIPSYVHQLTPVLLRADTSITNHGFRDGRLTAYPAVLQAGTAVLVDGFGTPRVKCYCGNPLSAPPQHEPTHFSGTAWHRFEPVTVIVIRPAPVVVQNLTVVNIQNNTVVNVEVPPWHWGPPPGWSEPAASSDPSSSDPSSDDPSSDSPGSNPNQQQLVAPTGCGPSDQPLGDTVTPTSSTCPATSTSPSTTTTTTTTPTTTTDTTTTTTDTTDTTTTTTTTSGSGSVN